MENDALKVLKTVETQHLATVRSNVDPREIKQYAIYGDQVATIRAALEAKPEGEKDDHWLKQLSDAWTEKEAQIVGHGTLDHAFELGFRSAWSRKSRPAIPGCITIKITDLPPLEDENYAILHETLDSMNLMTAADLVRLIRKSIAAAQKKGVS